MCADIRLSKGTRQKANDLCMVKKLFILPMSSTHISQYCYFLSHKYIFAINVQGLLVVETLLNSLPPSIE